MTIEEYYSDNKEELDGQIFHCVYLANIVLLIGIADGKTYSFLKLDTTKAYLDFLNGTAVQPDATEKIRSVCHVIFKFLKRTPNVHLELSQLVDIYRLPFGNLKDIDKFKVLY